MEIKTACLVRGGLFILLAIVVNGFCPEFVNLQAADDLKFPTPVSSVVKAAGIEDIPEYFLPPVDTYQRQIEDAKLEGTKDIPFRYGEEIPAGLSLVLDGLAEQLENGTHL